MRTGIRRVTVAELHADTEAIIADLPQMQGIQIVSSSGESLAWLTSALTCAPTVEEAAAIRHGIRTIEDSDPAVWESDLLPILSLVGEEIAWIQNLRRVVPDLTPEQVEAVKASIAAFEHEDPATWMDHDEFMRQLDEDERLREAEGR